MQAKVYVDLDNGTTIKGVSDFTSMQEIGTLFSSDTRRKDLVIIMDDGENGAFAIPYPSIVFMRFKFPGSEE